MKKKYIAELIGTFGLALAVILGASSGLGVPVLVGLVVGLFVYTIGGISGCHINPAVTLGLLSLKKISRSDAVWYVLAQLVGAGLALAVGSAVGGSGVSVPIGSFDFRLFLGEALGAAILTFGIASVVLGKVSPGASGLVIGGSLLLGITMASLIAPGAGILNPAVAVALRSLDLTRILGPVAGSLLGFWTYRALA